MPKYATEMTQGQAFTRTAQENGVTDTAQRVYKILLLHPAESFNPQTYTGTYIGSRHPTNLDLVCTSLDAKFEGDSRMVAVVTFSYQSYATVGASAGRTDPKTMAPAIRPANWSTDTTLVEIPSISWRGVSISTGIPFGPDGPPINPVGDRYEGVTKLVPSTTIRIDQFESQDPLRHASYCGVINKDPFQIGSLGVERHTLMLRGVSSRAHVESFGDQTFRGWIATFEFSHRVNFTKINDTTACSPGWDKLQIVEGYNVRNVAGSENDPDVDPDGLALQHANYEVIVPATISPAFVGKKSKANIGVQSADGNGKFLRPSSQPIALNSNGTPRKIDPNLPNNLNPIVLRYQVQQEYDFTLFGLRLT